MKASFVVAVLGVGLLCSVPGCGSDDDDDGGGGSEPEFSCTISGTDDVVCTDYSGNQAFLDGARNSCVSAGETIADGACPTDGVSGICTFEDGDGRGRLFYYDVMDGLDVLETGCTDAGGTWSTG